MQERKTNPLFVFFLTEKFQAGTEFEANKMNVPESTIPRNMNARLTLNLFGYKTDAIEVIYWFIVLFAISYTKQKKI